MKTDKKFTIEMDEEQAAGLRKTLLDGLLMQKKEAYSTHQKKAILDLLNFLPIIEAGQKGDG